MENHDHNIIGRAFEYYNNCDENKSGSLGVKAHHTLTLHGLLAEGGIFHDMQWHKNNNTKNNTILGAIFQVLKQATNPDFASKLHNKNDVYEAIDERLGNLKGHVQTNIVTTLISTPGSTNPDIPDSSGDDISIATFVPPTWPKIDQPQRLSGANNGEQPESFPPKKNTFPSDSNYKSRKSNTESRTQNKNTEYVKSKPRADIKKESFITNSIYSALIEEISQARNSKDKKEYCLTLLNTLYTDAEKLGFENDSKILGYKQRAEVCIKNNTINDELIYELKFFANRIAQLNQTKKL